MREVLLLFLIFLLLGCYVSVSTSICNICQGKEQLNENAGGLTCSINSTSGDRVIFNNIIRNESCYWFNTDITFTVVLDDSSREQLRLINISVRDGSVKFHIHDQQGIFKGCYTAPNPNSKCGQLKIPLMMKNNAEFTCSCTSLSYFSSQSTNPAYPPVNATKTDPKGESIDRPFTTQRQIALLQSSSFINTVITTEENNNKSMSLHGESNSPNRVTVIIVPIVVVIIVVAVSSIVILIFLKRKKLQSSADDKLKKEDPSLHREDTVSGIRENVLYIPGDDAISPGRSEYAEVSSNNAGIYEDSSDTDVSEVPSSSEIASTLAELDSVSQMRDDSVEGTADIDDFPIYAVVNKKRPRDQNQNETDFEKETI